jgi:hypothetical protein
MHFRFKDLTGKVVSLPDVTSLMRAIRDGIVTPKTPLAVGENGAWHRAELVKAYREATAVLQRLPAGHALLESPTPTFTPQLAPAQTAKPAKLPKVVVAAVAVVIAAIGFRLWTTSGPASGASAGGGPSPAVREVANKFTLDFGDSVALVMAEHQRWLQDRRLDRVLYGEALKSPEAVRSLVTVSTRMRIEGDAILPRSNVLARRMVARADSLSRSRPGLEGLAAAVEDGLGAWGPDFESYNAYQHDAAQAFDALAEFLRSHQQGFAIRDGRPVFLSREDGARFGELWDHVNRVPAKERAWADQVIRKRPGWMSGLPDARRPRFGQSILAARD